MSEVIRVFVEKKPGFDVEARHMKSDLVENLGIREVEDLRLLNRYDISGLTRAEFEAARGTIFSEPNVDAVYDETCPLDGWRVVQAVNRKRGRVYRFLERYGSIILIVLIGIHFLANFMSHYEMLALAGRIFSYVDILGYIMRYVVWAFQWPITALWGLVF